MSDPKQQSWPQLPSGGTDWETVFEDPKVGLITRVSKADTIAVLRETTILDIKQLFAGAQDPAQVEKFVADISAMLSDDLPDHLLPKMIGAVVTILRRIKFDRIEKANISDPDILENDGSKNDASRQPVKPSSVPKPGHRNTKKARSVNIGPAVLTTALVGAIAVGVAGAIFMAGGQKTQTQLFIEQIEKAAKGEFFDQHVFGGGFTAGMKSGRRSISAKRLSNDVCASVAWSLINRGTVVINDILPIRPTPRVLKKLCASKGNYAKITWYPKAEVLGSE